MSHPVLAMIDDFFPHPELSLGLVKRGVFESFKSPFDGVVYPAINHELPAMVKDFIGVRLCEILGQDVHISAMFARTMLEGMKAPHRIHSDKIMGKFSLHIYASSVWPKGSGTCLWDHEILGKNHTDATDIKILERDHQDASRWHNYMTLCGKYNRAVIHDACMFHSAEPSTGWGDTPENGRTVITAFFSAAGGK